MNKKLFLFMLAMCALTMAAAQTSPTNTATQGLFSGEISQSFSVVDWSEADVGNGIWFLQSGGLPGIGAAGYTEGGTFLGGYAKAFFGDYTSTKDTNVDKSSLEMVGGCVKGLAGFGKDTVPIGVSLYAYYSGSNAPETKPAKKTDKESSLELGLDAGAKIAAGSGTIKPQVFVNYHDSNSLEKTATDETNNSYIEFEGWAKLSYLTEEKDSMQHEFYGIAFFFNREIDDAEHFGYGASSGNGTDITSLLGYNLFYTPDAKISLAFGPKIGIGKNSHALGDRTYETLRVYSYIYLGNTFKPTGRFTANGGFTLGLPSFLSENKGFSKVTQVSSLSCAVSGGFSFDLTDNLKLDSAVDYSYGSASTSLSVIFKK